MQYLRFRVGVRYSRDAPWNEADSEEWRGILDLTPRCFPFVLLALRNRIELRWLSGDFSMRYRARLTIVEGERPPALRVDTLPFRT